MAQVGPELTLARVLGELRRRKGFTRQSLADASDVSATYIGQIESGIDPRSGKEYRPSPPRLRMLADAMGRGDSGEADRIYRILMEAAAYLPPDLLPKWLAEPPPAPYAVTWSPAQEQPKAAAPIPDLPAAMAAPHDGSLGAALPPRHSTDPRLHARIAWLLEHWNELTASEQVTVLEFLEFIEQKRTRRMENRE